MFDFFIIILGTLLSYEVNMDFVGAKVFVDIQMNPRSHEPGGGVDEAAVAQVQQLGEGEPGTCCCAQVEISTITM
jgi:hypothetical protein